MQLNSNITKVKQLVRTEEGHDTFDFRGLNSKTIPERHPLPRIQDLLDNLGGHSWFSIIDQGSAYPIRVLSKKDCQHMTAFNTPSRFKVQGSVTVLLSHWFLVVLFACHI